MAEIAVDYVLFDLDGTLVSTTHAAERAWAKQCAKYGVDTEALVDVCHGSRTEETFAKFFPTIDNTNNQAVKEFEVSLANDYMDVVAAIPGAVDLMISLDRPSGCHPGEVFPRRKWGIVTSGSPWVAHAWFDNILKHIAKPEVFVTAFDVPAGKPDPEGYKKATLRLSEIWGKSGEKSKTVVFEDSIVGVQAGKANGSIVVALTSTYDPDSLYKAGADYVVEDLAQVSVVSNTKDSIVLEVVDLASRAPSVAV